MQARQVRPLDAAYLALDGPRTVGHVCLVLPLDGPITLTQLREQVGERVGRLPELRQRLHQGPNALDRPWWVDDPTFDIEAHVEEFHVGRRELSELVSELAMEALPRTQPLWQVHLLREGRRCYVMTKVHHSIADGSRYRDILHALFGTAQDDVPPWSPQRIPSAFDLATRGLVGASRWAWTSVYAAARAIADNPQSLGGVLNSVGVHGAPPTPFNRSVGPNRVWAFRTWGLAASKPTRAHFGVTVNDVMHAVVAAGLRQWLIEQNALPTSPLVALVPMSVRHLTTDPSGANRLSLGLCRIPTDIEDPVERIFSAREDMAEAKERPVLGEGALEVLTRLLGPTLEPASWVASTVRLLDTVRLPFNTIISNVPMGQDLFVIAGRRVTAVYPFAPLGDGMGVSITIQGYQGRLDVGISACADLLPDVEHLMDLMTAEYAHVCTLASLTGG
ncbi:MAG: wax ester/triacylglycerol synthase family O-acyltransferase [Actinomycetales bacterium]|jgi:diacylglycerol O-acyltransferase|uniref:Diacylglycerol O-acyltransferase n=1 Tax=Candidatus Phosphoribacter hodrii TaxID=2953743 RepID=A0A935IJ40_9MICO|nr:wax ester/triacylglycerol synthase family O-acyltransferase [Candidatus Phosphoribacter hodrii]OPZ53495.1 MAG: putative diacylglycerol O-acyltransferase [bacterium ADurb.BinA028]HNV15308.1 wax ester/triacylglycerol synthase family O-acyltransferase [Dermatophilaceae bacterium]HOA04145.1 wax ester/triacylglycerol synthase family O-acyltransferase [Dermatophilaceae bacterium]HPV79798.1 wax ester/triacylglycerol synthase family O-acyltransferase [Dermatophilaceae bacterium]